MSQMSFSDAEYAGKRTRREQFLAEMVVNETFVEAPSSAKKKSAERDPEMASGRKGDEWHFGMKVHIGVDADSGLVHTAFTTPANESDVAQTGELLHGKEEVVHGDSGYLGAQEHVAGRGKAKVRWESSHRSDTSGARRAFGQKWSTRFG